MSGIGEGELMQGRNYATVRQPKEILWVPRTFPGSVIKPKIRKVSVGVAHTGRRVTVEHRYS